MGLFASAWNFLKSLAGGQGTRVKGRDPRPYLAGQAPGLWASNHLEEANEVKGWNFVAIRTMSRMAASAETAVHHVVDPRRERRNLERRSRLARAIGDRPTLRALRRRLERLKSSAPTAQGTKEERRPAPYNDPLLRLLHKPNPNWSGSLFRFQVIQQLAATGSGILWCVRNQLGVPHELYVIPTGLCIPRMPTAEFPRGSYWITPLSSWGLAPLNQDGWVTGALGSALLTGAEVDARDCRPVRWPHPLYLSDGQSTASAIAMWIDVSNEMDRACWYGLQNTERPGMVFEQDPAIDPEQADKDQFREDLAAEHAGTPNTGKHLLLPKGIISRDRGRTPAEMDYQDGRLAYRDMILAAHGVSPVAAGIVGAGSYSQFWAAIKQTTELAVQPMLDLLGEEITQLLGNAWPDECREVNYKARAIDDPQLLENRLATDIRAGNVLLVKEHRAMRGLPPLGDERDNAFVGAVQQKPAGPGEEPEREREERDREATDNGTGTREPLRDAVPGRQDREGKSHTNGRPTAAEERMSVLFPVGTTVVHYPASGPAPELLKEQGHKPAGSPEGGQFTGEGGNGSSGGKKPKAPKKPKEDDRKGSHPGAAHGSEVKVTVTKQMAAPRNDKGQIDPVPVKTVLSKQETGRVAEAGIRAYLRDVVGIKDTVGLNSGKPNESIDLFGDSMAPEVKGGMCNVSKKAQQWRITFSMELGKQERAEYDALTPDQQKAWREKRQRDCLKRKLSLLKELSEKHGREIKPVTFTGVVNPDTQTLDIYKTDGYHQRISWNDPKAKHVASVRYDHA